MLRTLGLFPPPKSLGKGYVATRSAQDCITGYGLPSRGSLIHMFVSSADMNLLLLIALELSLAPLHALHDTSYGDNSIPLTFGYIKSDLVA